MESGISEAIESSIYISIALAFIFFSYLFGILFLNPRIFNNKRYGRTHAIFGFLYLFWILFGFGSLILSFLRDNRSKRVHSHLADVDSLPLWLWKRSIIFDIILGILGIYLPLTAAFEFKHHGIKNVASGTLDEHATVTHNEMIEHAFYQGINLIQILFLHSCHWVQSMEDRGDISVSPVWRFGGKYEYSLGQILRCLLLSGLSAIWLIRHRFPINKFSDNYLKVDQRSSMLIRILYRIKKYQYIFYKHFLLHGLNITVALSSHFDWFDDGKYVFRLYWLLLNTSYVMEFFLQTLVKKKYMKQTTMLGLQHILMLASSIVAIFVLQYVNVYVALASLVLNFLNRKFDFFNTMLVYFVALIYFT